MINVIKMDLYRMFKSKFMWITIIISLFFPIASMNTIHSEFEDLPNPILESMMEEGYIREEAESYLADPLYAEDFEFDIFELYPRIIERAIIGLLITIFTVIFIGAESNTGYIKNIAGQTSIRHRTILSKMVVLFLYSSMIFLLYLVISVLCSKLIFGYIHFGIFSIEEMVLYVLSQIFLNFVFGCVIMCGSELIRNLVVSMAVGVILTTGIFVVPMMYLDELFKVTNFSFTSLILTPYMERMTVNYSQYGKVWIVGAAFLVIGTLLSITSMKKRDIR